MFEMFKQKSISLKEEISSIIDEVQSLKNEGIDTLADEYKIRELENYKQETEIFLFIIVWLSIQASKLSLSDKDLLTSSFRKEWCKRCCGEDAIEKSNNFLLRCTGEYERSINSPSSKGVIVGVVDFYAERLNLNSPTYSSFLGGLLLLFSEYSMALMQNLNEVNRKHRFN